ncbi:MAG: hypothetical protein Q7R89_01340 [bacterium]|nr:hypothetical protein [bacterium]
MIKKISILFLKPLLQRAREDPEFLAEEPMQFALNLPTRILGICLGQELDEEEFEMFERPYKLHLREGHWPNEQMKRAFTEAHRIESLITQYGSHSLGVQIRFFRRARKTDFYRLTLVVEETNSKIIYISYPQPMPVIFPVK